MSDLNRLLAVGLTYRQIDAWTRNGWLRPHHAGGTGNRREWTTTEVEIGLLMKRLTDAGFTASSAAEIARTAETIRPIYRLTEDTPVPVDLGVGLTLTINPTSRQAAA